MNNFLNDIFSQKFLFTIQIIEWPFLIIYSTFLTFPFRKLFIFPSVSEKLLHFPLFSQTFYTSLFAR